MFSRDQEDSTRKRVKAEDVYEIRKEWDVYNAGYIYCLYYGHQVTYSDGSVSTMHTGSLGIDSGLGWIGDGDWAWAERSASHYGISMPE